jgi:hypothetical protein
MNEKIKTLVEKIEHERDLAMKAGYLRDYYIDNALKVLLQLNPIEKLAQYAIPQTKGEQPLVSRDDIRIKEATHIWIEIFLNTLKTAQNLPVDLMAKAVVINQEIKDVTAPNLQK